MFGIAWVYLWFIVKLIAKLISEHKDCLFLDQVIVCAVLLLTSRNSGIMSCFVMLCLHSSWYALSYSLTGTAGVKIKLLVYCI